MAMEQKHVIDSPSGKPTMDGAMVACRDDAAIPIMSDAIINGVEPAADNKATSIPMACKSAWGWKPKALNKLGARNP